MPSKKSAAVNIAHRGPAGTRAVATTGMTVCARPSARCSPARAHRHLEWLSPSWSRSCTASWRQGCRPGHSAVRHRAARKNTQSRPLRRRKSCSTNSTDHPSLWIHYDGGGGRASGAVCAQLHPETMCSAVDLCNTSALYVAMRQQLTEDVGRVAVAEAETVHFVSVVNGRSQS